ncbi:hypothetical protein HF1_12790 [Mycoplasma haemofelis str. Langford 1]|uniref:Uncharacterized protein n=1 Tax=Mycoplasma haemofelis (strain Langford 1) TaxID=941640 RepID=E8ZJG6_MYCHL|nr:hypothetical protein [Mycoplasma haemofelis]CBY93287.1 hypothetical protein HF1_12790 [Mycoplasma haemofelis str. Langford 1]
MSALLIKSLILAGGASLAVGGGFLAFSRDLFPNSKTIKNKLISEKYQILDTGSNHWSTIFSKYNDSKNTSWKFEGQISNEGDLKSACKKVLEREEDNQSLYKSASKWCVVPRKAEEFVSGLLKVEDGQDAEAWGRVLAAYKKTKVTGDSSTTKYALGDVSITDPSNDSDAENKKALQKGCKDRKGKFTYDLDFDSSIQEMKEWCLDRPA